MQPDKTEFIFVSDLIATIQKILPEAALYEQLAEECSELCKELLKKARKIRNENYTPKTHEEIDANIIEEYTDVLICTDVLNIHVDYDRLESKDDYFKEISEASLYSQLACTCADLCTHAIGMSERIRQTKFLHEERRYDDIWLDNIIKTFEWVVQYADYIGIDIDYQMYKKKMHRWISRNTSNNTID